MNGIHLEAYVLEEQLRSRRGLVAIHCENGCPFQQRFMKLFTERVRALRLMLMKQKANIPY